MTCYFRQLQEIFKKAGIEITSQNKHEVDKVIHELVGVDYKSCPATWKEVKKRIADDKEEFVSQLRNAWKNHA